MDWDNPIEIAVHYLIIRGMTCFDHQDKVSMVNTLMCLVTHLTRPTVNHDVRLSNYHDLLSYYIAWTLNLKMILSLY